MHKLLLVAVEADNRDDAVSEAEGALHQYHDDIYDWYAIGGRWAGCLAGGDTLCYGDDPESFASELSDADDRHNAAYQTLRNRVVGVVPADDDADPARASRVAQSIIDDALAVQRALAADAPPVDFETRRAGWLLSRLGEMISGNLTHDTAVWDAVDGDSHPGGIWERVGDAQRAGRQWLVAVDLHF